MNKKLNRLRRSKRLRAKLKELQAVRLCVHRTPSHIYAQIISAEGDSVIASASTLDKQIRDKLKSTGNKDAAEMVGKLVAKRALDKGVQKVAFDRSGFNYHGRVKALADAARESGLQF